jgi:uncharacterized protein YkwD
MRRLGRVIFAVVAYTVLTAGNCDPEPDPSGAPSTGFYGGQEADVGIRFVNHRQQQCPGRSLSADERLASVARVHSKDLADNHAQLIDAFPEGDPRRGHIGSDGSMPEQRIRNVTGLNRTAENVFFAFGHPPSRAAELAWDFWIRSPGHKANIDNCDHTIHGVGVYYDAGTRRTYVTHNFAG